MYSGILAISAATWLVCSECVGLELDILASKRRFGPTSSTELRLRVSLSPQMIASASFGGTIWGNDLGVWKVAWHNQECQALPSFTWRKKRV